MSDYLQKWFWRTFLLLLFAASLLYLLLLVNGIRFDFYTNEIRRTGIIDIFYDNSEALVYLDGKLLEGRLPFVATNVLPGKYQVTVSREGYWDYLLDVAVYPDLITRIGSVFLVPRQLEGLSRAFWAVGGAGGAALSGENGQPVRRVFWDGGYFFWIDGKMLSWGRLDSAGAQLQSMEMPFLEIESVEVVEDGMAVLTGTGSTGKRGILDLADGAWREIGYGPEFQYLGNRWLYLRDDVIVLFDRDIRQILWAKQPQPGRNLASAKMFNEKGKIFLSLRFADNGPGAFYLVEAGGNFTLLAEGEVDWVQPLATGEIDYLLKERELWTFLPGTRKSMLRSRFGAPVEMINSDLELDGSRGIVLFRDQTGLWMADRTLDNVRMLFAASEAHYLYLQEDGTLFLGKVMDEANAGLQISMLALSK